MGPKNEVEDDSVEETLMSMPHLSRIDRRKSSIAAIFEDRRHDVVIKRPSLRRLWAKYDVPYIIGEEITHAKQNLCETTLLVGAWCLVVVFFPFSLFFTLKVIQEYERAVIFRLGRLVAGSTRGPGIFFILPCVDTFSTVDIRTVSFDVPPQEVLTRDSVTVAVDAVVYYRVFNPTISVANVENAQESTRLLAQTSLRNVLGTRLLSELLSDRGAVSNYMRECLDEATDNWGIKVERVEIKDVRLPTILQRIMATEAEAAREARAKIIASEGEYKASKALKHAADILSESPYAIQLRYLQTLNSIAAEQNSTIIFPLPMEFLQILRPSTTAASLSPPPSRLYSNTPTSARSFDKEKNIEDLSELLNNLSPIETDLPLIESSDTKEIISPSSNLNYPTTHTSILSDTSDLRSHKGHPHRINTIQTKTQHSTATAI
ncbi:unnamed protein product [Didymodactylos carnosus]|uniref:Band 7 domain-containing protein n=1 Tax=Didymodactylos carnosus TaxID=1234261 RepID=A0A813UD82_9BILA|nr:unnamed protein product [Didymodactylos carnosus]CAF0858227.1 unnamed protein product [Didymodactylos carnosus]CAF3608272.1 unnamed protein product [Didymodactylos carnosus]CAF3643213.1 unnamed protein product [Didymodactylos carnosus]